MSAGHVQLAALGIQDVYLTRSPQVTYFSGVYKRHTPFVLEAYEVPFNDQNISYGSTSICRVPAKGDLVQGLTLKLDLPPLYDPGTDWTWPLQPSLINVPSMTIGRNDGTVVPITGVYNLQYFTTNLLATSWLVPFASYVDYDPNNNSFVFKKPLVSNVTFLAQQSPTNAGSGVFWGFDPSNYTRLDPAGNLVYTGQPDYTLEQVGWVQTLGNAVNSLSSLYLTLNQSYSYAPNPNQFLNFKAFSPSGLVWSSDDLLKTMYTINADGSIKFLQVGYYTLTLGIQFQAGSTRTFGYEIKSALNGPSLSPNYNFLYTFTVSPGRLSSGVIPFVVSDVAKYYYFYFSSNNGTVALPGSYFLVQPVCDIYQLNKDVSLSGKVQLYGNVFPTAQNQVTLYSDSTFKVARNGEYLVTGSLDSGSDLNYVSTVSVVHGSTVDYTYNMSLQGKNPTFAFSMPLVANTLNSYSITVNGATTLKANSFFTITQVGVLSDTVPGKVLTYQGVLLQSNTTTYTNPLNLSTNFSSNTNSTLVSINASGRILFSNAMSYTLTAVVQLGTPPTSLTLSNTSIGFSQTYTFGVRFSGDVQSCTATFPFRITDTSASYSISLDDGAGPVNSNTYITISPLSSNVISSGTIGQIYNYHDSVGTLAIVRADLRIGGKSVQTITGEYIELWNELNIPYENQPGLQVTTGKYDTATSVPPPGRSYYVNLPFYFYGSPELSIPIVALDRQDVEVWVTFNTFSALTATVLTNPTIAATMIVDYVYLADPEINWFKTHQIDYLITQTQYETFTLAPGLTSSIFELKFRNPVKELFFVIQVDGSFPYDYSQNGLENIGMTFNGLDAILTRGGTAQYLGAIEPFNHHVNFFSNPPPSALSSFEPPSIPGRQFYMYSFSTEPGSSKPSGSVNMSRIRNVLLELNMYNSSGYYPAKQFKVTAVSQNVLRVENGMAGIMFE